VLQNASWSTRCTRNCWTTEAEKHVAYRWYAIEKPAINSQEKQVCELDHLVPLELGGSDTEARDGGRPILQLRHTFGNRHLCDERFNAGIEFLRRRLV
jgi:hypothetical protein